MSDIVERLRETQDDWPACLVVLELEAAAEIEKLRAALKPFLTLRKGDRWETGITETTYLYAVPEAFLRAAAAALKETGE